MDLISRLVSAYRRWKYLQTPRPTFEPTVTPVERHWTPTDEKLERLLYLANPNAFWLRPDRNEYKVPCWQIEGFWEEPVLAIQNFFFENNAYSGNHARQAAMYDAAMIQQRYMNQLAQTAGLNAYGNYSQQNSLGGSMLGLGLGLGLTGGGKPS